MSASTAYLRPNPRALVLWQWGLRGSVPLINFAALCLALLHKDNPLALSVLDPTTGNMLEHCQLRHDPWYKRHGIPRTPMNSAVSAKALAQGRPPTPNVLPVPTHSIALTTTTSRCTRGRKYATPWLFVKSNQKRMTLTPHKSPLMTTASATLVMWVPTQHPWNCSSSSSTVYSCKKVHALAPSTLRTSTLTHPSFHKSSLTNTSSQVWIVMDGITSKSARVVMACSKQAY